MYDVGLHRSTLWPTLTKKSSGEKWYMLCWKNIGSEQACCHILHKIDLARGIDSGSVRWVNKRISCVFPPESIPDVCLPLLIALEQEKLTQNTASSQRFSSFNLANAQRAVHAALYSMILKNFVDQRHDLNFLFLYQFRCTLRSQKFSRLLHQNRRPRSSPTWGHNLLTWGDMAYKNGGLPYRKGINIHFEPF